MKTCTIEDCERPLLARKMCSLHYSRWRQHGDPTVFLPKRYDGCSVEDCEGVHRSNGYCDKHAKRWRRWGDPLGARPVTPAEARFWAKVNKIGPVPALSVSSGCCWQWTAGKTAQGYGGFHISKGEFVLAHRYAYEVLVGPIPEGLVIDHRCRNRACVNPDHLEVVTLAENTRRGYGPSTWNRLKTHCPADHPYSAENTYICPRGGRRCRECARERDRQPNRLSSYRRNNTNTRRAA